MYGPSKKLAFVPVASAMTAVHRDRPVLASYAPRPEILDTAAGVSRFPLTFRNRRTDNYNLRISITSVMQGLLAVLWSEPELAIHSMIHNQVM